MTLTTADGGAMRKCVTPGCMVHVYPGKFCSSCGAATISLAQWRARKDEAENYTPSYDPHRKEG